MGEGISRRPGFLRVRSGQTFIAGIHCETGHKAALLGDRHMRGPPVSQCTG